MEFGFAYVCIYVYRLCDINIIFVSPLFNF